MGQRNKFGSLFSAGDPGDASNGKHVTLGNVTIKDSGQGFW
jgi:hypothetical protein